MRSSLLARVALTVLVLLAGAAHAIHLADPNRADLRLLDGCLVAVAVATGAWVLSERGDRRRAATSGFVVSLVLLGVAVLGF